jgi:hypothetical protein
MLELKREIKETLKGISPAIREKLFVILDFQDKGAVSE